MGVGTGGGVPVQAGPSSKVTQLFPLSAAPRGSPVGSERGRRPGGSGGPEGQRGAAGVARGPLPRRAGARPALVIGQSGLRARVLMSGGRGCGGRSGGGRPAARARVGGLRVGVAASMLLGCGSASHTRGALVLASSGGSGGGAGSGARVCSGAGSERAARRRGSGPGRGSGTWHGAAEGRRRGAGAAAAAAGRRVPDPAERAGEAAGALPRHLQLYQGVHHLRGLFLGAQDRAGRHQLPVSEWDPASPRPVLPHPAPAATWELPLAPGRRDPDPTCRPLCVWVGARCGTWVESRALEGMKGAGDPETAKPGKSPWQCF